jgi:hypothetical protein
VRYTGGAAVKEIVASLSGREFLLDLPWSFRYTAGVAGPFKVKGNNQRTGKAVSPMCFSPCFVHATQAAFVRRQLLQCRTCGSQAFHVLDCCRNPNYVRVPTSRLGEELKSWLGGMHAAMQAWLFRARQRRERPLSPEALDAWEARPVVVSDAHIPQEAGVDHAMEGVEHETVSAPLSGRV